MIAVYIGIAISLIGILVTIIVSDKIPRWMRRIIEILRQTFRIKYIPERQKFSKSGEKNRNEYISEIERSVKLVHKMSIENGKAIRIEVSGNIGLDEVKKIADCNVDYISVGSLTHSVKSHDFSLLFNEL